MRIAARIALDEHIASGKPIIEGTRVPVDLVLGKLAGGMSYAEIMTEYELAKEDILAALDYAARLVASEEIRATGTHA